MSGLAIIPTICIAVVSWALLWVWMDNSDSPNYFQKIVKVDREIVYCGLGPTGVMRHMLSSPLSQIKRVNAKGEKVDPHGQLPEYVLLDRSRTYPGSMVDIRELDKAELLSLLVKIAIMKNTGFDDPWGRFLADYFTAEEAQKVIDENPIFHVHNFVELVKIGSSIDGDFFDARAFDLCVGKEGTAEAVINYYFYNMSMQF